MATRRYMVNEGDQQHQVTEAVGAAIVTKSVELTIDLAAGLTKTQAINAIEEIKNYISKKPWPPA